MSLSCPSEALLCTCLAASPGSIKQVLACHSTRGTCLPRYLLPMYLPGTGIRRSCTRDSSYHDMKNSTRVPQQYHDAGEYPSDHTRLVCGIRFYPCIAATPLRLSTVHACIGTDCTGPTYLQYISQQSLMNLQEICQAF